MLAHATIIGRNHRLMNQNCQDFAITGSPKPGYGYGIVLDGCGSKYREKTGPGSKTKSQATTHPSQNEVGARLIGQFLAQWLNNHLSRQESLDCLADKLQLAAELFTRNFILIMGYTDPTEKMRFIHTNLLATILGFAFTPATGCFFWAGDGYLHQGNDITHLNCDNRPPYLAYNALNGRYESTDRPKIESRLFSNTEEITWLAVATDGWQPDQLAALERPQSSLTLQRRLNIEAQQRGRFEDDGAIALWTRDDA